MRSTDWLLLLIAILLASGIGTFIWHARKRSAEIEMLRTTLLSVASRHQYFHASEPVPVTFDASVNKALVRFQRTAIDLQGMIELIARWIVAQAPHSIIENMEVPKDWVRND